MVRSVIAAYLQRRYWTGNIAGDLILLNSSLFDPRPYPGPDQRQSALARLQHFQAKCVRFAARKVRKNNAQSDFSDAV